jgi:hypothetical protein
MIIALSLIKVYTFGIEGMDLYFAIWGESDAVNDFSIEQGRGP